METETKMLTTMSDGEFEQLKNNFKVIAPTKKNFGDEKIGGDYQELKIQMETRKDNFTSLFFVLGDFKFFINKSKYGPSIGIPLDPEVPSEKLCIDRLNDIYEKIISDTLKHANKISGTPLTDMTIRQYIASYVKPSTKGGYIVWLNMDDETSKFPTKIFAGNVARPTSVETLMKYRLTGQITMSIGSIYSGSKFKLSIRTRASSIKITNCEMKEHVSSDTTEDEVSRRVDEMLKQTENGQPVSYKRPVFLSMSEKESFEHNECEELNSLAKRNRVN